MERRVLEIGLPLESDTYYFADKKQYDIYMNDTKRCEDKKYLCVEHGSSDFLSVAFMIKNKKNITIDFGGATIVLHGRIQPFIVDHSENIMIKNCIVEYDRPFYTETEILEVKEDCIKLKVRDGFSYRIEGGKFVPISETWENHNLDRNTLFLQVFDPKTRDGAGSAMLALIGDVIYPEENPPMEIHQLKISEENNDIILHGYIPEDWKKGMILAFSHEPRDISSIMLISSNHCTINNYRIINGAGMGLFAMHSKNIYMDGFRLCHDESSKGIISNSADAIHAIACSGDFKIENSIFEGMIDDALNIHNNFYRVASIDQNVLIAKKVSYCLTIDCENFLENDEIAIYKDLTMEREGTYIINKMEKLDDNTIKMTLNKPLSEHHEGDLVENLSTQPNIEINNCKFGKSNSHIRFQSRGKIVVDSCEIGLPILLTGDASYWFESSPLMDFTIQNCFFSTEKARIRIMPEIMPTQREPFYHKNINLLNNTFVSQNPVDGRYADNIVFCKNKNTSDKIMTLTLKNCGDVHTDNSSISRSVEIKTKLERN